MRDTRPFRRSWRSVATATLAILLVAVAPSVASAAPEAGDDVWIGAATGYGGTSMHAVYPEIPADPDNAGVASLWAYCIEQRISARSGVVGEVGDLSGFLGDNFFATPEVQAKVLWVLAHGYPAVSLADLAVAAGVSDISENDAIEATQYAIWRYTDLGFDAAWAWETPDSQAAYEYLVDGANASAGLAPSDFETTVTITGPATPQLAGRLVGPFTVSTNQTSVSVVAAPSMALTDATGTTIDASAVVDGQEFFLDARGTTAAGGATVTASAVGSSATGKVISVPTDTGELTADDHAQSLILVAPALSVTTAEAAVTWAAIVTNQAPRTLPATGSEATTAILGVGLLAIVLGVAGTVAGRRA